MGVVIVNKSINKIEIGNKKNIPIVANTELTIIFNKNIKNLTFISEDVVDIFIRYDGELAVVESNESLKIDSTVYSIDLKSDEVFKEISIISTSNAIIQVVNARRY